MPVGLAKSLGALAIAAGVLGTTAAIAADPPKEMKLYVFTSGGLTLDKSIIQNGSSGKVTIPVGFFLIRHPKGDVLFDCGNNDKIITDPDYWGPFVKALDPVRTPDIAIDAQLGKINVKPSDIKYVVLGHFHVDHAGNVGKFPDSTFVYQRDEIKNAFWPAPGYATFFITQDFALDAQQHRRRHAKQGQGHGARRRSRPVRRPQHRNPPHRIAHARQPDDGRAPAQARHGGADQRCCLSGRKISTRTSCRASAASTIRPACWTPMRG